jgi:hypothetical protein
MFAQPLKSRGRGTEEQNADRCSYFFNGRWEDICHFGRLLGVDDNVSLDSALHTLKDNIIILSFKLKYPAF